MKIWINEAKGDDRIIAFFDQTIYRANPKPGEIDNYILDLKKGSIPSARGLEIPLGYIREIVLEEGRNYIDVQFGSNSNEYLTISDNQRKLEIFETLKKELPVESITTAYSKIRSARKPLIAMIVVGLIFLWTLYIAIGVENGNDYEVAGDYRSVAGIVLALAYLGVVKVILLFGSLMAIAVYAFLRKYRKPLILHRLIVKR